MAAGRRAQGSSRPVREIEESRVREVQATRPCARTSATEAALTFAAIFWLLFSSTGIVLLVAVATVWIWMRPSSRTARFFLAFVTAGFTILSLYPVSSAIFRAIGSEYRPLVRSDVPPGRSVVVLLGSGTRTRKDWSDRSMSILDSIGLERTLEAARAYQLVGADWIISSGGLAFPEDTNDPAGETMKAHLVELGVPADRVLIERDSRNTREEAVLVAKMLPGLNADHVVLVTSQVHMRRALGVFRAAGIDAIPAVAREPYYSDWTLNFLPTEAGLRLTALSVHELAGLAYYWLRGWYR
jgi:uncharacterized SAM-binding protein YcdF (DUF218 family)